MTNKRILEIFICCSIAMAGFSVASYAQGGITDTRLRSNLGVSYEPTKKLEVTARYRLTNNQNMTAFMRSMFSVNAGYEILKNLDVAVEYRYNTDHFQDYHRYLIDGKYKYGIGDFDISYRLRYQQDQDYFDAEYLRENPTERVFRNRLMLKYEYNKKTDFYTFADHFTELKNKQFSPYRVRYGAGVKYMYKRRHDFAIEFFVNDEFNSKRNKDVAAIDVSYVYHLTKKKKKKKKKDPSAN